MRDFGETCSTLFKSIVGVSQAIRLMQCVEAARPEIAVVYIIVRLLRRNRQATSKLHAFRKLTFCRYSLNIKPSTGTLLQRTSLTRVIRDHARVFRKEDDS
jgi:hypothetical protein